MRTTQLLCLLASTLPSFVFGSQSEQMVLSPPNLAVPHSSESSSDMLFAPTKHTKPSLFDILTIDPSVSIFFSYARELEISKLFSDESARATVLAPTNKAVMALARKPHQGPASLEDNPGITEQEFENRSRKNVERWVTAHIVPESPISLSSLTYPTLLQGKSVTFTSIEGNVDGPEWGNVLLDDTIRITGMKEASNGVLYIIDSTIVS